MRPALVAPRSILLLPQIMPVRLGAVAAGAHRAPAPVAALAVVEEQPAALPDWRIAGRDRAARRPAGPPPTIVPVPAGRQPRVPACRHPNRRAARAGVPAPRASAAFSAASSSSAGAPPDAVAAKQRWIVSRSAIASLRRWRSSAVEPLQQRRRQALGLFCPAQQIVRPVQLLGRRRAAAPIARVREAQTEIGVGRRDHLAGSVSHGI